jgi:hypothetical protein
MKYFFLFHLLGGFMGTGGTLLAYGMYKRKDKYVMHPVTIVRNKLITNLMISLRIFISGFACLISGSTSFDASKILDFGIFQQGWVLENTFGNVVLTYTILWNLWWTYELYISVKNPMVFSEMNLGVYSKLLYFFGIALAVFMYFYSENSNGYTIMCMNKQNNAAYTNLVVYPTVGSILVCLMVNLKYGKEKYLRTFRKNSHKFRLLFRLHFIYVLFWAFWSTLKFAPLIAQFGFYDDLEEEDWIGISSTGVTLYPFGLLICFTIAWFYNKKYYYQELSKIGYIERLISIEENLKNFKEVIRKEVCEQIVKGIALIFNEREIFHPNPEYDEQFKAAENMKKNNITKVKDAVIKLVKQTRDKLTNADIRDVNIRKRVDLVDNMQIRKESRTKRSFYLGDDQNSWSIEEYAPRIFQNIRRIFEVKNQDILNIFKEGWEEDLDINISTGKTGSFFLK